MEDNDTSYDLKNLFGTCLEEYDNCYTIGAIHTINNESDYAYDMKRPKLGEAMFDVDDIFENIFAAINVCPKIGNAMFINDDIFSLPSFDMQSCYDKNKVATYDDYCDETYAIKSSNDYIYKTCHDYDYPFLNITLLMWKQFIVFESLMILPLFRMRRILLMWRVIKFLCL